MAQHIVKLYAAIVLLLVSAPARAADERFDNLPVAPLQVRNLSPVGQLYGVPRMVGARIVADETWASFNLEATNNFQRENRSGTFAFFDGESYLASYRMRSGWREDFEWGLEIPYIAHTNGGLDGLVDEFHELFGLPDGGRNLAPRGRLDYLVRSNGSLYADFQDSRKSLGDVRGFLGYRLLDNDNQALALRAAVKLPTGDVEDLSGSEGTDVSVWGEYERGFALGNRVVHLSLGGGVGYLGEGELIPEAQEDFIFFGHLGLQIPLHRRVSFIVQLDAHTAYLDTGNPLVAEQGVLGTLGGRIGVTDKFWVDLAVIEDLNDETAADVTFQILLGARL